MIAAMVLVMLSANLSWVRMAGPQSFNVAATFRLISVTTALKVHIVSKTVFFMLQEK